MTVQMDETFAAALRDLLVEQVHGAGRASRWFARPSRWIARAGVVLLVAAGAGGIAYAAGVWTTEPGGDAVSELSSPVTATGTGTQTVDLGTPPTGTTALYITFTCLTAGDFTFADGAGVDCDSADAGPQSPPVTYTMSIAPGQDSTTITATPSASWRLVATYASVTTTAWGVNASGQTYGIQNQHGTPDLVAVIATNHRSGYVYASQLFPPPPNTIAQALAQDNAPPPSPRTLTVYESDGKTPIGEFVAGG
ncbi:MAG: peptidase M56 family protein [Solirubrobacteraceae bacterium]|jgi:hypothetical protein